MSERELVATVAATIMAGGRRFPEEAVRDALEIIRQIDQAVSPEPFEGCEAAEDEPLPIVSRMSQDRKAEWLGGYPF